MTPRSNPANPKAHRLHPRRLLVVLLCLAAGVAVFSALRPDSNPPAEEVGARQSVERDENRLDAPVRGADSMPSLAESAPVSSLRIDGPEATLDYSHESFTHVPDWLPRPTDVASARAIDASLRSDGYVEGTLEFTLGDNAVECLDHILSHLEVSGLTPVGPNNVYLSEDKRRRCEIHSTQEPAAGGLIRIIYQGIDHERGCHCPTCDKFAETLEP